MTVQFICDINYLMILRKLTAVALFASALFLFSASPVDAAIKTINGLRAMDQTFTNDSNIQINSPAGGSAHIINWNGLLPISRGGTGAGSFGSGSVLFSNGTTFAQDNSNLFWDNTNNRLGLGTSSPSSTLDVNGNTSISGDLNTGYITTLGVEGSTFADFKVRGKSGDVSNPDGATTYLYSGDGFDSGSGGLLRVAAGDGGDTGNGGALDLYAGRGLTSGNGGNVTIYGGQVFGTGNGGSIFFRVGEGGGGGTNGSFNFFEPTGTYKGTLDFSPISADQTFTFPNTSGTFGLLQADQTWSGLNKFEASSNSTIYVGSSTKSGCIALGDSDGDGIAYVIANDGVLTASTTKPSFCQ